jgi:hypothetical protein
MPQRGWVAVGAVAFGIGIVAVATRTHRRDLRLGGYCAIVGVWLLAVAMLSGDVVAAAVAGVLFVACVEVLVRRSRREAENA